MDDLNQAVDAAGQAVAATPQGHPDRAAILSNIGSQLSRRFGRTGAIDDLNHAVNIASEAVDATPQGHPDQAGRLSNLGNRLGMRFELTGEMEDLHRAVDVTEMATLATPPDHPDRTAMLNNLGSLLGIRFERTREIEDLSRAVEITEMAVEGTPLDQPDRAVKLANLGNLLGIQFERTGVIEDLNRAIDITKLALEATPSDLPGRAGMLSNLGNILGARFERTREIEDLKKAAEVADTAAATTPSTQPGRAAVLNIAQLLGRRLARIENMAIDIDERTSVASSTYDDFSDQYEQSHSSHTTSENEVNPSMPIYMRPPEFFHLDVGRAAVLRRNKPEGSEVFVRTKDWLDKQPPRRIPSSHVPGDTASAKGEQGLPAGLSDRGSRVSNPIGTLQAPKSSTTQKVASSVLPKRFALLVGIDFYLNDGSRKSQNGNPLSLGNLQGCVNDVEDIEKFLHGEFGLTEARVLASSMPSSNAGHPKKMAYHWPTFANIKREFDTILEQAGAGDTFFFHFSGHGAQLQPTSKSPTGRFKDPSLLTMDFCCGKPAVRGWQLNKWLERFNKKKIRTVVVIDSCHSGGAWRIDGRLRTPEDWDDIPNLPTDEIAITETVAESDFRYASLEASWSINPDGLTLMAACESHEKAAEKIVDGKAYGAFTHGLLVCLRQSRQSTTILTYRNLRDQIARRLRQQTPRVYGRDRLVFFGDKEPFSVTPLVVRIDKQRIVLPIGNVHGVRTKSEFTPYPPTSHVKFSVDYVDEFECSAPASAVDMQALQRHHYQVIPCRWSLGTEVLRLLTQPKLGGEFQEALHAALQDRVVGEIEITETEDSDGLEDAVFRLTRRDDGAISLYGPPPWIGYEGRVRGLDLCGDTTDALATKCAVVITHLTRFSQVLGLRNSPTQQPAPFQLTLIPEESLGTHDRGQNIGFTFKNITDFQLHFALIVLSSGFHIKQLYPVEDSASSVEPNGFVSLSFNMMIPSKLRDYSDQRDIIRIVVTRGRRPSWKSLELPDIWDADQLDFESRSGGPGRDASLATDAGWWFKDYVVVTEIQSERSPACWVSQLDS